MGKTTRKENKVYCSWCTKPTIHNPNLKETGNNIGDGGTLGQRIMEEFYKPKKIATDHPLSIPRKNGYSIAQAHHLICSESMNTDEWAEICKNFGYDINCKENGIFLPADMRVACQLKIPLHRGNHSDTESEETPDYVDAVKDEISAVAEAADDGVYCENEKAIINKLNRISKVIWGKVKDFEWILTYDGADYDSGHVGCSMRKSLTRKKELPKGTKCKLRRKHGIKLTKAQIFKEQKT